MTQPNSSEQSGSEQSGSGQQPQQVRKPRTLAVVKYDHHDAIFGRTHEAVGVVVAVGDVVTIRPLAGHTVQVDPAVVTTVTAADEL